MQLNILNKNESEGLKRSYTNSPMHLNKNKLDYNIYSGGSGSGIERNTSFENINSKKYANED